MAAGPASSPPNREATMLCWLKFGEHAALRRDVSETPNVIRTVEIQHFVCRIRPMDDRDITHRASPWGGPNALLASIW